MTEPVVDVPEGTSSSDGVLLLEARDVVQRYPVWSRSGWGRRRRIELTALDNVQLAVRSGRTVGVVGESGSGKSTLMRLLLLLERPTSGSIRFRGNDMADVRGAELREFRRNVQAVFQDPYSSLNPRLRIGMAVAEPLLAATPGTTRSEARARAVESLVAVGLPREVVDRLPHELSGGQRQRVAIARALITTPELIVLDEPVSALDVSIRAQVTNLLLDIQQQFGVSYVLVAHDLSMVRSSTDEVVVMYLGRIIEAGPTEDVFDRPRHPYTQALLANSHGGLDGFLSAAERRVTLPGEMPSPLEVPTGCRFHPRCPVAMDVCRTVTPPVSVVGGHAVECHLHADVGTAAESVHTSGSSAAHDHEVIA